jgi:hypothetical protein
MTKASTITSSTGREWNLHELAQALTYEGWLEQSKRPVTLVHVVTPIETPLDPGPAYSFRFGAPAALPSVSCVGRFRSEPVAKEEFGGYSELTFIWFQSDFAMPIEPDVLQEMIRLDWDTLATDTSDW